MFENARIVGKSVNPVDYHKQVVPRGDPKFVMSSSSLREMDRCARRWLDGYVPPESDAKDHGSLFDCLLLTPDLFDKRYSLQPDIYLDPDGKEKPWSNNAKFCRAWAKKQEELGFQITTKSDVDACKIAIKRFRADFILNSFVEASDVQVHVEADWRDPDTGLVVPCRALIDCVPRADTEFFKSLGDVKTTKSAARIPWQRWSARNGYHVQAAFHRDMYVAATGEDRIQWHFLIQENFEPWQTARRMLTEKKLNFGRMRYQMALTLYCRALKSGEWPDYDDHPEAIQGWTEDDAEPFEEYEIMSRMMLLGQTRDGPPVEEVPAEAQEADDIPT